MLNDDVQEVLITKERLAERIAELGKQISKDYENKDLMLIGVLKGSVPFMADLMREITVDCTMDFMAVSSYGSSTQSSGVVRILKDLDSDIENKHVLIVEDIIDTGYTLKYLLGNLNSRKPADVEICCLLDKPDRRMVNLDIKYEGFKIPDAFVIGYGLDYAERYRNLPFIGILKKEVYETK
ncbi:MAG: hypoxanthine phosphoribosyltransferase [Clostridiales bacterium]|nr:hypoxanthine phosphoribosyltransferase [Clostridiales bacterium]HBM79475.1 hypoxanthine phosphoribosyltransferase [Clostridiaceae bacterium]